MLCFGTFPRLTETVTFISGRTDLLASLGAAVEIEIECIAAKP